MDGHELCFNRHNIDKLDLKLLGDRVVRPNVSNCCYNMEFFDITIYNDGGIVG